MVIKKLLSAAVFLVVLTSTAALAEVRQGAVTVSPYVGGYLFEGDQGLRTNNFMFGIGVGYLLTDHIGVEGVFGYINGDRKKTTGEFLDPGPALDPYRGHVNGYLYKVEGLYHFNPTGKFVPFVAAGVGGLTLDPEEGSSASSVIVDYGAGFQYFLSDNLAFRTDVRHLFELNEGENNLMYTAGLTYYIGGGKPAPAPVAVTPAPVAATPPPPPVDSDGDGVIDENDKCPDTPKGVKVDANGCPLDTDGDGVYDYLDKCPDTPKGVKVDVNGCPLDTDGDGVYDYLDKCPDTPKGVKVDANGCPPPVEKAPCKNINIEFDTNKSFIKPMYHDELKRVADCLKDYPENKAVIEGHTDSVGSASANEKLSQERAESVRKYLIENFGISPDRLSAKGYGESRPIADNNTEEGRQKNRRIELNMIQ